MMGSDYKRIFESLRRSPFPFGKPPPTLLQVAAKRGRGDAGATRTSSACAEVEVRFKSTDWASSAKSAPNWRPDGTCRRSWRALDPPSLHVARPADRGGTGGRRIKKDVFGWLAADGQATPCPCIRAVLAQTPGRKTGNWGVLGNRSAAVPPLLHRCPGTAWCARWGLAVGPLADPKPRTPTSLAHPPDRCSLQRTFVNPGPRRGDETTHRWRHVSSVVTDIRRPGRARRQDSLWDRR